MEQNDHDLLICIDGKLRELKKQFENHLNHHFWINISLLGIIGGLITALIVK